MDANVLIRDLEEFKKLSPDMQVITMLTFLFVGRSKVAAQKEIEDFLGLSNAAASRNINYWTKHGKMGQQGRIYMEREESDEDRRYKVVRLTKLGNEFYRKITEFKYAKATREEMAR